MAVRDNISLDSAEKSIIVGIPTDKHKMSLSEVTASGGNSKITHSISWGTYYAVVNLTASTVSSGTSVSPKLYFDTDDFYDLTAYSKLCVAINHTVGSSHTGHACSVILVAEDATATKVATVNVGKFNTLSIDISKYTGKYKIRISMVTGYATYGYGASVTSASVTNVALGK